MEIKGIFDEDLLIKLQKIYDSKDLGVILEALAIYSITKEEVKLPKKFQDNFELLKIVVDLKEKINNTKNQTKTRVNKCRASKKIAIQNNTKATKSKSLSKVSSPVVEESKVSESEPTEPEPLERESLEIETPYVEAIECDSIESSEPMTLDQKLKKMYEISLEKGYYGNPPRKVELYPLNYKIPKGFRSKTNNKCQNNGYKNNKNFNYA